MIGTVTVARHTVFAENVLGGNNMLFTILPLKGIQWGNQSIFLGEERIDVKAKLGDPEDAFDNSYYYFDGELRFDFSADGKLVFIEFLGGMPGRIQPVIFGVPAFQAEADELYHILEEQNSGEIIDDEDGYSYAFPNIGVVVWRRSTPSAVVEFIKDLQEEMQDSDVNLINHPDVIEERLLAAHWASIAVAASNYPWRVDVSLIPDP